jgi:hypothetical protein
MPTIIRTKGRWETVMSRRLCAVVLAASVGLLVAVVPLRAHHSEAAEFDATKPVRVTGVVKKVEWTNPHIWFYVEGKDEVSGLQAVWGFSGAAPNGLRRRGITRESLKVGDTVKVQGIRAKDGSPNAASRGVTFSDGRQVFTASEQTPVPK